MVVAAFVTLAVWHALTLWALHLAQRNEIDLRALALRLIDRQRAPEPRAEMPRLTERTWLPLCVQCIHANEHARPAIAEVPSVRLASCTVCGRATRGRAAVNECTWQPQNAESGQSRPGSEDVTPKLGAGYRNDIER